MDWATRRFASRPQSKTRLIPAELFEQEKPYLVKLPAFLEPVYQEHERKVDPYGYVAIDGNFYWVPEKVKGKLTVVEYEGHICIYQNHKKLIEHHLAPWNVKNKQISPEGVAVPYQGPRSRKYGFKEEEKRLREMGGVCSAYLDYIHSADCRINRKPALIRELYRLAAKMSLSLFLSTIERAAEYRIASLASIERIAQQLIKEQMPAAGDIPDIPPPDPYESRSAYRQGRLSSEADLSRYRSLMEEQEEQHDG